MRRKKERSKVKQTNKAKQHSTPKAVMYMYIAAVPPYATDIELNFKLYSKIDREVMHTYVHVHVDMYNLYV